MKLDLAQYKQHMGEYFSICAERSVLEIGPYLGLHTEIIVANKLEKGEYKGAMNAIISCQKATAVL